MWIQQVKILIFLLLFISPLLGAGKPLRVVTTTTDLADMARQILGKVGVVESLSRGNQNPHSVESRPHLIKKLAKADLYIQIGLGLEKSWVDPLLQGARNKKILPGSPGHIDVSLIMIWS